MLGFGATGQYGLGEFATTYFPSPILVGVGGDGAAGELVPVTGSIPAVYATGAVGSMIPSTLQVNPRRLLSNVLRRLRTLGSQDPQPM
mgnify:CR=1 FL=1